MSANAKKSAGATIVLILLGVLAMYAGQKSLAVMIPVALLVWYGASPGWRSGPN